MNPHCPRKLQTQLAAAAATCDLGSVLPSPDYEKRLGSTGFPHHPLCLRDFPTKKLHKELYCVDRFRSWKAAVLRSLAWFFFVGCAFLALQISFTQRAAWLSIVRSAEKALVSAAGLEQEQEQETNDVATKNISQLYLEYLRSNGSSPCHHVRTHNTIVLGLPPLTGNDVPPLLTDVPFTLMLVSISANGTARCSGGDFYETELVGEHWRSRPPVTDHGNGSYSISVLVDGDFPGLYNFTAHLLFDNFHGLDEDPQPWSLMRKVVFLQFRFASLHKRQKAISSSLEGCKPDDLRNGGWMGRWTREWYNESCEADDQGRYRCIPEGEKARCKEPWCEGRVSLLESNGWAYSSHCSFHLWEIDEAWECLNGKWMFFWGDSNFQDVIRNLLLFVLGVPVPGWSNLADWAIDRKMEEFIINPARPDQFIHISLIFNGHHEIYNNGLGLDSLRNESYRDWILRHFNGSASPDIFIMNAGLHDGRHFSTVEEFLTALDFTVEFWNNVFQSVASGKHPIKVLRTAVAPAATSRSHRSNPHKMEVFNAMMVDKLSRLGDLRIIDAFDPTFPFHFDHNCSDGMHYGLAPKTKRWPWLGKSHQYFVDLMLVHMMLNAICPKK